MGKLIFLSFLFLFNAQILWASLNTIYQRNTPICKAAHTLCIANGVIPPSSISPIRGYEILAAIKIIPEKKIDKHEKSLRDWIVSEIQAPLKYTDDFVGITPIIEISPECYMQTDTDNKVNQNTYTIKDLTPFTNLGLRITLDDSGYAFGNWGVISPGISNQLDDHFNTNFEKLTLTKHDEILDGGLLLGNDYIFGGIFRTPQEMGYGITGNLIVGDNFQFQDFLRLGIRSELFDYILNLTHFDQMAPYDGKGSDIELLPQKFNGMQQYQLIHRFEFKLWNKLQIMLTEGIILNSTSAFDIRLISPFIYLHSFNNHHGSTNYTPGKTSDEENNYTTAELSWTAMDHLRFNFHFLMDQIQMPSQKNEPNVFPQAYGILLNIESPWIIKDHYLNTWFEIAAIMPYTYLNHKRLPDGSYDTNLDMIV